MSAAISFPFETIDAFVWYATVPDAGVIETDACTEAF
jgi:hypothetical protein